MIQITTEQVDALPLTMHLRRIGLLMAAGLTVQEIARELRLSAVTVKVAASRIAKLMQDHAT